MGEGGEGGTGSLWVMLFHYFSLPKRWKNDHLWRERRKKEKKKREQKRENAGNSEPHSPVNGGTAAMGGKARKQDGPGSNPDDQQALALKQTFCRVQSMTNCSELGLYDYDAVWFPCWDN